MGRCLSAVVVGAPVAVVSGLDVNGDDPGV